MTIAEESESQMLTHFVTALMIGNLVTGVWLVAGSAFAAAPRSMALRGDIHDK